MQQNFFPFFCLIQDKRLREVSLHVDETLVMQYHRGGSGLVAAPGGEGESPQCRKVFSLRLRGVNTGSWGWDPCGPHPPASRAVSLSLAPRLFPCVVFLIIFCSWAGGGYMGLGSSAPPTPGSHALPLTAVSRRTDLLSLMRAPPLTPPSRLQRRVHTAGIERCACVQVRGRIQGAGPLTPQMDRL